MKIMRKRESNAKRAISGFLDFERSEKPPEALRVYKSSNLSVRNSSFLRNQKISCQMISYLTSFDHKITCPKDRLYPTKKSHSTLRAKRSTFKFLVDKSLLKSPKMVHFGEFECLKT